MVRDLTLSLVPSEPSSLRGWYEKQPTKVYTLTQNANKPTYVQFRWKATILELEWI